MSLQPAALSATAAATCALGMRCGACLYGGLRDGLCCLAGFGGLVRRLIWIELDRRAPLLLAKGRKPGCFSLVEVAR